MPRIQRGDNRLGLTWLRKHAAIQSRKTKIPSKKRTGLDARHRTLSQRGVEDYFFLTSSWLGARLLAADLRRWSRSRLWGKCTDLSEIRFRSRGRPTTPNWDDQ
jgi:hypothetical protein